MNDEQLIWEAYRNRIIDFDSFTPSQLERYKTNLFNKLIKFNNDDLYKWHDKAIQIRSDYDTEYSLEIKWNVWEKVWDHHDNNRKLYLNLVNEIEKLGEQVRNEESHRMVDEIYETLSSASVKAEEFYQQGKDAAIFTQAINNLKNNIRTIQNPKVRSFFNRMLT